MRESAFQSEVPSTRRTGGAIRHEAPAAQLQALLSPRRWSGLFTPPPAPDQPVFVKVGDKVDENTIVCIIEAMKVMNEVKAGVSGIVAEILADNAQPVEFGTRLLPYNVSQPCKKF